jgi:hypothetical protein
MAARLTDEEKALRTVTERQFQSAVERELQRFGWLYYHAPDNKPIRGHIQNIKAGFPDLVAVRGTRIMFIELKRRTGATTPAQDEWHAKLLAAGMEVHVWRPGNEKVMVETLRPDWAA